MASTFSFLKFLSESLTAWLYAVVRFNGWLTRQ